MNPRHAWLRMVANAACLCAVLAGCGAATPSTAVPVAPTPAGMQVVGGQPFQLAPGQSAELADGTRVRFVRVTEDSRCPQGVQCVTAGQASVMVEATHASGTDNAILTLRGGGAALPQASATVGGHAIHFAALTPSPSQNQSTNSDQYRATFVLDAASS